MASPIAIHPKRIQSLHQNHPDIAACPKKLGCFVYFNDGKGNFGSGEIDLAAVEPVDHFAEGVLSQEL